MPRMKPLLVLWRVLLAIPCWLFIPPNLSGQEYTYLHYQQGYELPSPFVNSIFQADDGRIWVATRGGVSTYNGSEWSRIERDVIKTPNIAIERVIKGRDGSIWAIDSNRINKMNLYTLDKGDWKKIPSPASLLALETEIWIDGVVHTDREGQAFLALTTNSGSLVTYQARYGWSRHSLPVKNRQAVISGITPYFDSLLISTSSGLYRYENRFLFVAEEFNSHLSDLDLLGVAWEGDNPNRQGALWVMGKTWIRQFGSAEETPQIWKMSAKTARHSSLLPDGENGLYLLIHQGNKYRRSMLFHYACTTREEERLDDDTGMQDRIIQCLGMDVEKNLWIGTSKGVSKLVNRNFKSFHHRDGLLEDEVSALYFQKEQSVYIGHNTGYTLYRNGTFTPRPFPDSPLTQRVLDITGAPDGTVYMACNDFGLLIVTPDGGSRFVHAETPDGHFVNSVTYDRLQKKLWLACSDGLFTFQSDRFTAEPLTTLDSHIYCRNVQQQRDGTITVSTAQSGLFLYREGAWTQTLSPIEPRANSVFFCLQHDQAGMLAATSAGLYRADQGQLTPFSMGGSLLSDLCYSLDMDPGGCLWIGTQNGLLSWDGVRLTRHRSGDGRLGHEINRNAMKVAPDGRLWIGNVDGLSIFQPLATRSLPPPPQVRITSIYKGMRPYSPDHPLNLAYDENSFSLHFFCPSYINEYENRFRHRLIGFEDRWNESNGPGMNQMNYQNLPSGTYRFEIMAANADGAWGDVCRSADITILLPFWKSAIFIVFMALLALLIPAWAVYSHAQKKHARKLEAEVRSRTEQLSDQKAELERLNTELRQANTTKNKFFSIIAHDLRNPFTSLLTGTEFLIENYHVLGSDMKKRHTHDIHEAAKLTYELVNNLLDWSRTQLDRMEFIPSRIDLTRLIRQILKLFESDTSRKSLKITLLIPPRCDMLGDRHMMRFIFRNLISNAIKFTPRGGHISVTVYDQADSWSVVIQDTGVGIQPDQLQTLNTQSTPLSSIGTEGERGTGLGLILCREFIQLHKGRLSISSEVGQGSLFTVSLPKGSLRSPHQVEGRLVSDPD